MTNVNISMERGYIKVNIQGHAGYGLKNNLTEGHDIVCAAISILGQTLVQRLMHMGEEHKVVINTLKCEPGEIDVRVLAKPAYVGELSTTVKIIETGLNLIQDQYPDYIKVGVLDSENEI